MLQVIDSADDTVAVCVAERITSADLDAVLERLQAALAKHGTVHVYLETRGIDGVELDGLRAHTARAKPLLGRLGQFGRIAVVADQAWVRWLTRAESALLPFVSYRVFEPSQREQALAWVGAGARG